MSDRIDSARPLARRHSLIVRQLNDETLVYDSETDRSHCLNAISAFVWRNCDGKTSTKQLAQRMIREFHLQADENAVEKVAHLALDQLFRERLLDETTPIPQLATVTRRKLVRDLGLALALLPLITSIISPTAVEAATCRSPGEPCSTPAQCCSGLCSGTTCAGAPIQSRRQSSQSNRPSR
jgi:hypothetical protein